MLNPFKMFDRLAWLAILLFGGGTAVMVTVVVLATGGLGGEVSAPEDQPEVQLNDVVEKRELFENVPLPSEVSTETSVVTTNIGLAIVLALIFGLISTMLGNLIREEEQTFQRWFRIPLLSQLLRLLGWGAGRNVRRGCLTLPIIVTIFALYGLIFAFLEEGVNLLTPEGAQLGLVMAMSVGLISLAGDVAQRQVARFWRKTSRFGLYPANLFLAVGTTVVSRLFRLTPGIVFGVPGGADIDLDDEPLFREVVLAFTTLAVMVVLGGLGWAAAAAIRAAGDQTLTASQAEFSGPLAQLGLSIGLALFLVAVETSFFEMVPLSSSLGSEIFRWNRLLWLALFTPVMFVFAHTLLNPDSDYLEAFEQTNVQVLAVVIGILTVITMTLWVYFRVLRREPGRLPQPQPGMPYAPPPPPQYQPPPPQHGPQPGYRPPPPPVTPPLRREQPPAHPQPPPAHAPQAAPPPAQPSAPPPRAEPSQVPPTVYQPRPEPPPQDAYVPPPIVISDDVPPPIVIKDDIPPPIVIDEDRTQMHVKPAATQDETVIQPDTLDPNQDREQAPLDSEVDGYEDDDDTFIL